MTTRCLLSLVVSMQHLLHVSMVTEHGFLDYARIAVVTGVVSFQHYSGDDPQMWQPSQGVSKACSLWEGN